MRRDFWIKKSKQKKEKRKEEKTDSKNNLFSIIFFPKKDKS